MLCFELGLLEDDEATKIIRKARDVDAVAKRLTAVQCVPGSNPARTNSLCDSQMLFPV